MIEIGKNLMIAILGIVGIWGTVRIFEIIFPFKTLIKTEQFLEPCEREVSKK